jgi:hydroxyacylglutathione hydrolase
LIVKQIPAEIYTSNIYKISIDNDVWFVDIGNAKPAIQSLSIEESVIGNFITHSHYDHIHGINDLSSLFPDCKFFASEYAKQGLFSDKLNLSFYHENPIVYSGTNVEILEDNHVIPLSRGYSIKCIYTPGHNAGSMCFIIGDYLFTGDSYIPGIPVVTKLKSGDKIQNEMSLSRIKTLIRPETIICPGHGAMFIGKDLIKDGIN